MTSAEFTFYLTLTITTGVLIWGLKIIAKALESPTANNAVGGAGQPLIRTVLAEPPSETGEAGVKGSFSRTAGAIGAMGMAAVTIGVGYWILHELFFGKELSKLADARWYFLSGSALFFPYAFNQLGKIFKS